VQGEQRGFLLVGAASRHGPLLSGLPGAGLPDPSQFVTALEWFGGARKQDLRDFIAIGRQGGFAVGRQGEARRVLERHGRATEGVAAALPYHGNLDSEAAAALIKPFPAGEPLLAQPVTGLCYRDRVVLPDRPLSLLTRSTSA
jgi:hypothetical protein